MYYCDVERDYPQADGDEPAGDWAASHDRFHAVLMYKKSCAMLVFILFSTEENLVSFLCPSSVVVFPKFLHLILFYRVQGCSICTCLLCLLVSGVSPQLLVSLHSMCWGFPAALSVFVFHVLMVMLSLPRILDAATVACLTAPSWCTAEGVILVDPDGDRSGMIWLLFVL